MRDKREAFNENRETTERHSSGAHTLTHTEELILIAPPSELPDKAKIKWPNRKKWQFRNKEVAMIPKHGERPDMREVRKMLKVFGRNLTICETCGVKSRKLQIHHKDRNPWNNDPSNLLVLCKHCHGKRHGVDEDVMGILEEDYALGVIEADV